MQKYHFDENYKFIEINIHGVSIYEKYSLELLIEEITKFLL